MFHCCERNRIGTFSKIPSEFAFLPANLGLGDQITATFHLNFVPSCLDIMSILPCASSIA